jgi:hypothetical protein
MPRLLIALTLALAGVGNFANVQPAAERVGDTYDIRLRYQTRSESSDSSSSSSQGGYHIVERVIAVRDDGIELEFDFPSDATEQERAREWMFPARLLRRPSGEFELLNAAEMEQRIDAWLTLGGLTREACGQWYFTWNAFKVECDPHSVIATLEPYDLRPDVGNGVLYEIPGAVGPAVLRLDRQDEDGSLYSGTAELDAEVIHSERLEADAILEQMLARAGDNAAIDHEFDLPAIVQVEGALSLAIETDVTGRVIERRITTEVETINSEGVIEQATRTTILSRELIAAGSATSE